MVTVMVTATFSKMDSFYPRPQTYQSLIILKYYYHLFKCLELSKKARFIQTSAHPCYLIVYASVLNKANYENLSTCVSSSNKSLSSVVTFNNQLRSSLVSPCVLYLPTSAMSCCITVVFSYCTSAGLWQRLSV